MSARDRPETRRIVVTGGASGLGAATAYCASKFGVVGFTRALTAEYRGRIGVTLLTPGGMRTAFFDDHDEMYRPVRTPCSPTPLTSPTPSSGCSDVPTVSR